MAELSCKETLTYWIEERETIRRRKEAGLPKPWTLDPILQSIYLCNVDREDDKVTRWIRKFYSPMVDDKMFEYNIIFSRFINWPESLEKIGYRLDHFEDVLIGWLEALAGQGNKVWGNAYVITTHGQKMGKAEFLVKQVLRQVNDNLEAIRKDCREDPSLERAYERLQHISGIGTFLAGQVVADLKNTVGHPLSKAPDWYTFVAPGPGSIRGVSWFMSGTPDGWSGSQFMEGFKYVRLYVNKYSEIGKELCNQNLQNCLCEYDKYLRVKNGTGRSKRKYNGY